MIEQNQNKLTLTFPTVESATTFAVFLGSLLQTSQPNESSVHPSEDQQSLPTPDSLEPSRSRHVVLTPERQEQLFNQRQQGQSTRQRLLRAQTTLRDGVLPFSKPGQEAPQPSGQPSPRQKAALVGGFADGQVAQRRIKLKPLLPSLPTE